MINFFRKKRKTLADDNKAIKYVRYAIGEIVLVVVGILIALQINSWNQDRLTRIEEKMILNNIHNEFLQNKKALHLVLQKDNEAYGAGLLVMALIGKSEDEITKVNIDSIIYKTVDYEIFTPSENALSDIYQSGRLQLLRDKVLKNLLYDWTRNLKTANDNFEGFDFKIEVDLIPYLTKSYAMKDVDYYGPLNWKSKSILKINKLAIFQDIEYENLMDDALYRLLSYVKNLKTLEEIIDAILEATNNKTK